MYITNKLSLNCVKQTYPLDTASLTQLTRTPPPHHLRRKRFAKIIKVTAFLEIEVIVIFLYLHFVNHILTTKTCQNYKSRVNPVYTEKQKITSNKTRKCLRAKRSNKFNCLENKFLKLSYLLIKFRTFGTLKSMCQTVLNTFKCCDLRESLLDLANVCRYEI